MQYSEKYELIYRMRPEAAPRVEEFDNWEDAKEELDRLRRSGNYSYGTVNRVTTFFDLAFFIGTGV